MNYEYQEFSFPSSDGKNTIHAELYIPKGEIRGIVTLSHGMIDYVGRYGLLAEYLTGHGYIFAGNDHLGHGKTAARPEDLGYFAERDGYLRAIDDLRLMNEHLHRRYPDLPLILLGHSMGSVLARLYAERHPETIDALIIHGTGGKNPLLPFGKAVISLVKLFKGERYRSKLVTDIAFGSYNDHYDKSEGENAWLTRELERVAGRSSDPYTSFIFTASAYQDLFNMIGLSNSKGHFDSFPKDMPTLVVSGSEDPVGDYGRGVKFVYDSLCASGVKNVELKIYDGARHELFNETNREEVFADLVNWLDRTAFAK